MGNVCFLPANMSLAKIAVSDSEQVTVQPLTEEVHELLEKSVFPLDEVGELMPLGWFSVPHHGCPVGQNAPLAPALLPNLE